MSVYVEEFLFRGRCPDNEADKQAAYHVVLAQFVAGPDGSTQLLRTQPLTPEQADAKGFPLGKIVGEIAANAMRDKDAADKAAAVARDKAETASAEKAAAVQERDEALKLANEAIRQRDEARANTLAVAAEAAKTVETLRAQLDAKAADAQLQAEVNEAIGIAG